MLALLSRETLLPVDRIFGNLLYCLAEMGHKKEMHAQKEALPSQSTEAELNVPAILIRISQPEKQLRRWLCVR